MKLDIIYIFSTSFEIMTIASHQDSYQWCMAKLWEDKIARVLKVDVKSLKRLIA